MPEDINVEAGEPEEEAYVPPPYATYEDLNELGEHITDISNLLANDFRNTSFDLVQQFYSWGNGWAPDHFQPPTQ